jgi:hypothetical protein
LTGWFHSKNLDEAALNTIYVLFFFELGT